MLSDHRDPPIWYGLAELSTLTTMQWQALVIAVARSLSTDRTLLRLLFERPDRSDTDRQWLLDQVAGLEFCLDETLASPAVTADHIRSLLERPAALRPVVAGLSRRPGLADDPVLVDLAVRAARRVDGDDAASVARRWSDGQPVPGDLLFALLDRVVDGTPPQRGYRSKPLTGPVAGGPWSSLWPLLRNAPETQRREAACRHSQVQAVLLEYGENLDDTTVIACATACADRQLGGVNELAPGARLATLRRWTNRHPVLADHAGSAWQDALRDAVAAIGQEGGWDLVNELLTHTTDPQVLAAAVDRVCQVYRAAIDADRHGGDAATRQELDSVRYHARRALLTLAGCPGTPDEALLAALPQAPPGVLDELAALRPHLAEECTAERLSYKSILDHPEDVEPLVEVASDADLAATGDPRAALTGYLAYLPQGDQRQRARLSVALLRSRHADETVLSALPARLVVESPWHATLAAAMLADACRDDRQRWEIVHERLGIKTHTVTFGGLLAQVREYQPVPAGRGLAGYRYCHACHLVTPHDWNTPTDNGDADQRPPVRTDWMICRMCNHLAPPAQTRDTETSLPCIECGHAIEHPATAAVLACAHCGQMFLHPDLPTELRPRVDAVLAERTRIADAVRQLSNRIDQFLGDNKPDTTPAASAAAPRLQPPQLPDEWLQPDQPISEQFRTALATAIRRDDSRTRADATLLRFGLGRPRRPLTSREIAAKLNVRAATVAQNVQACLSDIHSAALDRPSGRTNARRRASLTVAHIANQILGDLDLEEPTAERIRAFIDEALPQVDPAAATRLLLRVAGRNWDLNGVRTNHLIWLVRAAG